DACRERSTCSLKDYFRKHGIRVLLIVVAAVLIIGLSAAARGNRIGFVQNIRGTLSAPLQKVLSSAANWFDTIYGYLYDYDSLMAENESLRSQLADAQQSARDGIEASEENVRLRQLLNLRDKHTDFVLESSKVVLWSSSNWSSSFTISKGARSGIEYGDPVITEYGALVGQVTELGETWATVSTLIDVDMSVGGTVVTTGSSGMVVGEYSLMKQKLAKLTFLADGAQIFVGDEILTSGSGGAFPAGLVIGTVSNVQTEAGGQIEYGLVQPQANLDSLVQVFIIKDFDVVE
ncbi:MAG: rod shape-determining protein MreC, partial [Oscillospiraceae bacterium]|nr:rod shape-determining protein MreC [Oscillospiraceae bacterium]